MNVDPRRMEELARAYFDRRSGAIVPDLISGLVLAVPPGSPFVRDAMSAEALRRGLLPLHVDLALPEAGDPGEHIAQVIDDALVRHQASRRAWGVDTLADKLERLRQASGQPLVLLIEEVQRAFSTQGGETALYALKAAREQLNLGTDEIGLWLVFSGADEKGLERLLRGHAAPFLGCFLQRLPAGGTQP